MADRGFELRIERAQMHLNQLDGVVRWWLNGEHHSLRTERDPQDPNYLAWFARADKPPIDPFSLILGDCLHNFRSSLDLLAFDLASAYTDPLPSEIAEDSEFPIFGHVDRHGRSGTGPGRFRDNGRAKIRGVHPDAQTIIERLQPYHDGAAYTRHPLWNLHELERINKHRLLHPVVALAGGGYFRVDPDNDVPQKIMDFVQGPLGGGYLDFRGGDLSEKETRVVSVPWPPSVSQSEMEMYVGPGLRIVLEHHNPGEKAEAIVETLERIADHIRKVVIPLLDPFLFGRSIARGGGPFASI